MTWIFALWAKAWFRYVLLAGLVLGGFAALRHHYISVGKQQGSTNARVESAQDSQKDLAATREKTVTAVKDATIRAEVARKKSVAAEAKGEQFVGQARAYAQQRQAIKGEIEQIAPGSLHRTIVQKLSVRPAQDVDKPGYTYEEEKMILGVMTEATLVFRQNEALDGALAAFREEVSAVREEVAALKQAQSAKDELLAKYETYYLQAYNALMSQKKQAWWTVFCLRKCGKPKKISVPDPAQLQLGID